MAGGSAERREPPGPTRRGRRPAGVVAAGVALLVGAACISGPTKVIYQPDELRGVVASELGDDRAARIDVPFEVTPDLTFAARRLTQNAVGEAMKLQVLAEALSDPKGFALRYDVSAVGGALDAISRRAGDCLSVTSLFIGLSRSIGIETYFLDARGVQDYATEGRLVVDRRHVVAGAGQPAGSTVIDFDRVVTRRIQYARLTDRQAMARYYNNLGFVHLRDGDNTGALDDFRTALLFDPNFPAAHNNLGVTLARLDRPREATEHFELALRYDKFYSAAMVNLADLHRRLGRADEAERMRAKASVLRLQDPLVRFNAGVDALEREDYRQAITELKAAVAIDESMLDAWVGLAQAYEAVGEYEDALKAVDRALRIDPHRIDAKLIRDRLVSTGS